MSNNSMSNTLTFTNNIPPIIIICYNNWKYVNNTIYQITKVNKNYKDNIIILDNKSNEQDTINFLTKTDIKVIFNNANHGPRINQWNNTHIFNILPDIFIHTDADLQFNQNLPSNFIEIMVELAEKYNTARFGFALDISDHEKMYTGTYNEGVSIYEWEKQLWEKRVDNSDYEIYQHGVDTTFSVVRKNGPFTYDMRIAGDFTCKHLPWYVENPFLNIYDNYLLYYSSNYWSTMKNLFTNSYKENFLHINKNNIPIFIRKRSNDKNLWFWDQVYANWENQRINLLDSYLSKNKIFIDIGAWIGTTCIYASRKSQYVYAIEADKYALKDLEQNCKDNCDNVMLIKDALYNKDTVNELYFGKNRNFPGCSHNDSTTCLQLEQDYDDSYKVETITLETLIRNNKINPTDISIIKVDIEGGEEYVLEDLYNFYSNYNVPICVGLHIDWWKDKNLDRFTFLTQNQKNYMLSNRFGYIVFN